MKTFIPAALALCFLSAPAWADEPDGLKLPPGFHASVAAEGLTGARHIAVRANGDVYISTRTPKGAPSAGIIALHIGPDGKADRTEHFGTVDGGTGLRFYHGALYAASVTGVYRFEFTDDALTPSAPPQLVVGGMPADGETNRPIAFDDKGGLYVAVGSSGNICTDANTPKGAKPVGLTPCPGLAGRGGVWRFDAGKPNQKFPDDGKQVATGIRDMIALDWRKGDHLYGAMQDRNGTSATWPDLVSAADEQNIAEEMHRLVKGSNLGWPTTYFDSARHIRLKAPEYGGDGKTPVTTGGFSAPVVAFAGHSVPMDLIFYTGKQFPKSYLGGAFVAFHGGAGPAIPGGRNGYDVVFVPFDSKGHPGAVQVFADGFAGAAPESRNSVTAAYRPVGVAVAPDGSLYVTESQKGKLWRITYTGK